MQDSHRNLLKTICMFWLFGFVMQTGCYITAEVSYLFTITIVLSTQKKKHHRIAIVVYSIIANEICSRLFGVYDKPRNIIVQICDFIVAIATYCRSQTALLVEI